MSNDFQRCSLCGELFFKEHLIKGKCPNCFNGPITGTYNEIEDETDNTED